MRTTASRPGRAGAVAAVLGLGGALLAVAQAPWVTAATATPLADVPLSVTGATAAPAVSAGALALLAAGAALGLAGRAARVVALVAVVAVGVLVAAASVGVVAAPDAPALAAAAEATGVRSLTQGPHVTAWPAVAIAIGLLTAATGAVVLRSARGWRTSTTHRYERAPGPGRQAGRPAAPAVPAVLPVPAVPAVLPVQDTDARVGASGDPGRAMDDWDALSRGEDPT